MDEMIRLARDGMVKTAEMQAVIEWAARVLEKEAADEPENYRLLRVVVTTLRTPSMWVNIAGASAGGEEEERQ